MFPKYIATTAAQADAEFVGRGAGPLLNPIANGILLAICLGSALMWWPRLQRPGQLLLIGIAMLLFWRGSYCTPDPQRVDGRDPGAWRWPSGWPCRGVGGCRCWAADVLAAALVAATQWENLLSFKRDEALAAEKTAESVELRPIMAVVAWHMFLDRPLLGCGYSQYKTEHRNYLSDRSTDLPLERARDYIPHNVVLSLLTETGLVGLGLFVAMVLLLDARRLAAVVRRGPAALGPAARSADADRPGRLFHQRHVPRRVGAADDEHDAVLSGRRDGRPAAVDRTHCRW